MLKALLIFTLIFSAQTEAAKKPLLKLLAEVDQKIVTTRDTEAYYIVTKLIEGAKPSSIKFGDSDNKLALDDYIIATMVFNEAQSFGVAQITNEEVESEYKIVKQKLAENSSLKSQWNWLDIEDSQLKEMVAKRLRAAKLIKYKSDSVNIQVSDDDARDYFEKNRLRFGSVEFESFKPTIKKYIAQRNSEGRLKEWIDILKKKHKVKKL